MTGGAPARGSRRLAEWISFGVSLALVLGLAGHLVWRMRVPVEDAVDARVTAQLDHVTEQQGRFVLPLVVENPSARTVRDLQVRIEYGPPGAAPESMDLLVDYLGQSSEQIVYAYFRRDPRALKISAEPISYRLD
jgi:uncharacterized protein (TIGR02588 family)